MKIAVMQPYFYPYLNYFALAANVDLFYVFDSAQMIKKSYIQRNTIRSNGNNISLTLPVRGYASQSTLINQVQIDSGSRIIKKAASTIAQVYAKSPNPTFARLAASCILNADGSLSDFLTKRLKETLTELNIFTEIRQTSSLQCERILSDGIRGLSGPENHEMRIIKICKEVGADTYINLPGGRAIYDPNIFRQNGIDLRFMRDLSYYDFVKSIISNGSYLSIIDTISRFPSELISEMVNNMGYEN
jgi:hypothetical protein